MNTEHARMIMAAAGALLVGIGAGMHYLPLGPLATGAIMITVSLIGTLRAG